MLSDRSSMTHCSVSAVSLYTLRKRCATDDGCTAGGMLSVALLANHLIKPVHPKYWMENQPQYKNAK
eukprot:m.562658 g.562658  ORF g.562658 m.562658 type:complete len:67 (+) comp22224_c0_seq1:236-436(+)